jgi:hypothetical protein
MRGVLHDGESGDQPESISTRPPVTGAALALDGLKDSQPAEDLDRFWLPPPPAGLLGGEELISRLRRAYMCFAIPRTKAEGIACVA